MIQQFDTITPDTILTAADTFGVRASGSFLQLNAMENRVYDIPRADGSHIILKFYRPGRWEQATLQAEHTFLQAAHDADCPVIPALSVQGQTLFRTAGNTGIYFAAYPKKPGRLEAELTKDQLKHLGEALARIHKVGQKFRHLQRPSLDMKHMGHGAIETILELGFIKNHPGELYTARPSFDPCYRSTL